MKLFYNIHAKRNTTLLVLLVWLFALASGIANACLLEARETHSHIAAGESSASANVSVIRPSHAGAVTDDAGESHLKAPCLKVCDDGSRSFAKQDSAVAQNDPGPAFLVVTLWGTVAPIVPTLGQIDNEQPATPALPLRIRFSRLAI